MGLAYTIGARQLPAGWDAEDQSRFIQPWLSQAVRTRRGRL